MSKKEKKKNEDRYGTKMDAGASVLIGVKRSILGIFESKYYRHYQWPETENC